MLFTSGKTCQRQTLVPGFPRTEGRPKKPGYQNTPQQREEDIAEQFKSCGNCGDAGEPVSGPAAEKRGKPLEDHVRNLGMEVVRTIR